MEGELDILCEGYGLEKVDGAGVWDWNEKGDKRVRGRGWKEKGRSRCSDMNRRGRKITGWSNNGEFVLI